VTAQSGVVAVPDMKDFLHLRMLALVMAGLMMAAGPRAGAQGFGLSVTPSATSMLVSNSLTYTINVTNLNGTLTTAFVTNQLPSSVQFQSASPAGIYTNYAGVVVFNLGVYFGGVGFLNGQSAQLTLTVQPTAAGFITNTITVSSFDVTNTASTNVIVQVTNAPTALADLGVMIAGPAQTVITNDWMTYGVTATNAGPNAATGVALTNTLPPGAILRGAVPANYTVVSSNLVFNLGALAAGGRTNFQFTIQPANAGPLTLSASIGSAVLDTNTANNFAVTNITVTNYLSGALVVFTNSAQIYNPQNGLIEQSVTLSNAGPSSVASARVVVTGLTNLLANAVGTNDVNPFVDFSASLDAGRRVFLLLQYYVPTRTPFAFSNSQLHAFAAPSPNWTPPAATATGTNLNLSRIVRLSNGNVLIEWPTVTNRAYTVVYSDNVLFSNAMIAPPSVTALGTRLQWIDYGPPATTSAPTNAGARFYRVFLNP
jgi:uncharacterized repeat protein (TIGR01451 family)